ncbi:MAG: thermosome subunit beta [Thermoplasmata archaeon]
MQLGGRKVMLGGGQPVLILKEGTKREKGRSALMNNIEAAKAIADAVKTTLGPKGLDKMLVDGMGDITITNDGVTILKEMDVENPAAKMLVEVAKTQDQECGDGTTTAVVMAGELLKKAQDMIDQNIHPTVIGSGYRIASAKALEIINSLSEKIDIKDTKTLQKIAETAMNSKGVASAKEHLGKIAVKAITSIVENRDGKNIVDLDNILIVKKQGGSVDQTEMIDGIIIDKERVHSGMPSVVKDAKIALIDGALEIKKTEIEAKIEIRDPSQIENFMMEEEKMLKNMVETIKKSGANVVFCQKGIDDLVQHYLAREKIYAVRRVKKSDMDKLAKACKANVVTKISELSPEDLGKAKLVEERKIGDDAMTFVTGAENAKSISILIRGGTEHVVDEAERSLDDALNVVAVAVEDGAIIFGGGATAEEIALRLRDFATKVEGREQFAVHAFADALEVIPRTLAENAGMNPMDILVSLRKAHKDGNVYSGVNVNEGKVGDMKEINVIEPIRVGRQAIESATEASVMILRIDDIIASKQTGGGGAPKGGSDQYNPED